MKHLQPNPAVFPGSPAYFAALTRPRTCGLSAPLRAALIAVAWAGTVAYGVHLYRLLGDAGLAWVGVGIAGGAAAAWVIMLVAMLAFIRERAALVRLGDHGLVTLTIGMAWVLGALATTSVFEVPALLTHAVLLGVGNGLMGTYFTAAAKSAGLSRGAAAVWWVGGMNGVLAVGLAVAWAVWG